MPRASLNGIEIDYALHGPEQGVPLLLIMGLGMQRIAWPDSLLDALAGQGFRCISFDNRDIGLSTRWRGHAPPGMARLLGSRLLGLHPALPYTLADMADDAAALLGHLAIDRAHVAGISMGGMVAQHLAARHPGRIASLSLLSTSSGRLGLPPPRTAVLRHMLRRPRGVVDEEQGSRYMVELFRLIGSPGFRLPDAEMERRARAAIRRAPTGHSVTRQLAAIIGDGDRRALLRRLDCPTLVLHGSADAMVPPAHARDLVRQLTRARLEIIEGWGHDLPDALAPVLAALLSSQLSASPDR